MALMLQVMEHRDVRTSGKCRRGEPWVEHHVDAPPPGLLASPVCSYNSRAGRLVAFTGRARE